ncbi:hypothetical protein [uncultured Rossellomorea sp.]|uniref:hypothetical protein n=1 Tax=uncultured Rossellomorea sp. TaxID=2837549 RepID=UPI0026092CE5|nr:hypothetical protein [uncultured Rossellomorea sp.]
MKKKKRGPSLIAVKLYRGEGRTFLVSHDFRTSLSYESLILEGVDSLELFMQSMKNLTATVQ